MDYGIYLVDGAVKIVDAEETSEVADSPFALVHVERAKKDRSVDSFLGDSNQVRAALAKDWKERSGNYKHPVIVYICEGANVKITYDVVEDLDHDHNLPSLLENLKRRIHWHGRRHSASS